jgi:hypothetical protein
VKILARLRDGDNAKPKLVKPPKTSGNALPEVFNLTASFDMALLNQLLELSFDDQLPLLRRRRAGVPDLRK